MSPSTTRPLPRRCFVTAGSVVTFRGLLSEILRPEFLAALVELGFDTMEVQCGDDHDWFLAELDRVSILRSPLDIQAIKWSPSLAGNMLACRSVAGLRSAGLVIAHAGAGTVMEALRYQCPLVVVPNPELMNNHQQELADECAAKGYAVVGKLGALEEALRASRALVADLQLDQLPPYEEPTFPVAEADRKTILDRTVLTCYYPDGYEADDDDDDVQPAPPLNNNHSGNGAQIGAVRG